MKILVVGGGSGGHVTPAIAVASEILKKHPRAKIEFWTDKKYFKNAKKIVLDDSLPIRVRKVFAGKFRRYSNFKFIDYMMHFEVVLQNIVDFFKVVLGFFQSFFRLIFNRPDVIFMKGGYACLAVGLAARVLRVRYVIHDSDTVPGLTNRMIAGGAKKIATGMPLEYYKYPAEKAQWTGIPVASDFKPVSKAEQKKRKKELGFNPEKLLLVIVGGSQGAQNINFAIREILPKLLKKTSVMLVAGRARYNEMLDLKEYEQWEDGKLKGDFRMIEFSADMPLLFGAADVVVSRAGASTMTELAAMHKAVVMVPFGALPGKHQVKNAEAYEKANAALVVQDEDMVKDPELLERAIVRAVSSEDLRNELAENLSKFTKSNAAESLADIVYELGGNK